MNGEPMEACEACDGLGFVLVDADSAGVRSIRRCDACRRFASDSEANEHAYKLAVEAHQAATLALLPASTAPAGRPVRLVIEDRAGLYGFTIYDRDTGKQLLTTVDTFVKRTDAGREADRVMTKLGWVPMQG